MFSTAIMMIQSTSKQKPPFRLVMSQTLLLACVLVAVLMTRPCESSPYSGSRIQCEYRDRNGDSLILNCTLMTGQLSPVSDSSGSVMVDSASGASSSSSLNLKVGMESAWRTPWESLTINHNIIRSLIWTNSRLAELGEYAFKDLQFLQKLDLSGNRLQHIQMNVFRSFELDLLDLDLSQNLFQFVPEKIFFNKRLENLELLRMNENPIQVVTASAFENLKSLKLLEMNYCQIKSIEFGSFNNLKQLESLSLVGNHLRHLNEITFRPFNLR